MFGAGNTTDGEMAGTGDGLTLRQVCDILDGEIICN